MPTVEFFGQSSRDSDNLAANSARLVNCYREPVASGGRSAAIVKSVPGLATFCDIPAVFSRALAEIEGQLDGAVGGQL